MGLETARGLVPVDTGQLKASLGFVVRQSDLTLVLYADATYAYWVEMGHVTRSGTFVPPQPYLRPGAIAATDALRGGGVVTTQFAGMGID